jgi:hypothetical protein
MAIIALMMEAVSTSETSVNNETALLSIPEDCHLHNRRRENLKSHFDERFHPSIYLEGLRKTTKNFYGSRRPGR